MDAQDVAHGLDRMADRWHLRERILQTASSLEERYALDPMLLDRLEDALQASGEDLHDVDLHNELVLVVLEFSEAVLEAEREQR